MGLLDDAIREHLDLKRRNGGDPGEIARKENEALTPVLEVADGPRADAEAPALDDQDVPVAADEAHAPDEQGHTEATYARASLADAAEAEAGAPPPVSGEFAEVGEETAELDMEAVLAEPAQPPAPESPPAASASRPVRASAAAEGQEDPLEWELPGDRDGEGIPQEIPGQERLSFE